MSRFASAERFGVGHRATGLLLRPRNRFHRELQEAPISASLSDDELTHVARIAVRMRRPAGELLIKEGEEGNELLIVLEGEIEVQHGSEVVGTIGPRWLCR